MSDKEIGKTTLFNKEDINVYDTVTLNTKNLIDAVENGDDVSNLDLTLEDFEQYKDQIEDSYVDQLDGERLEDSYVDQLDDFYVHKKTFEEEDIISKSKEYIPIEEENKSQEFFKEEFNSSTQFENNTFNVEDSNLDKAIDTDELSQYVDTKKFQEEVIEKVDFGKVKIMAIGIGGCGCNAIDRMQEEGIKNIELVAIDTSIQTLENVRADKKLLVGEKLLHGHGSGNDIDKAKESFEGSKTQIQNLLEGIDMIFITGGIGRGTGSAGLVEIGKYAREMGILTIGFATLPKVMEADVKVVEQYYELFTEAVDSNVIIENDRVSKVAYNLPINQAMKLADQMLVDGIKGISDLIINPGKINLDYADIKTAFSNQGSCIMGIGYGAGEDLVVKAINNSINSELVDIESMKTANTVIFNISCAKNTITIKEASDGTDLIYSRNASKDLQHMLFGYSYDETLEGKVKVTFIATGTGAINFDKYKNTPNKSVFNNDLKSGGMFADDIFTSVGGSSASGPDFFN